jgi:hypothetical protein
MSLSALDDLVLSCRTDEGRTYIAEAVACYKSGAYRACIVATWIAVVYDLLAKFRELALSGDAEAQHLTTEVTNLQPKVSKGDQGAIRRILEIERDIVSIANDKFAFFEGQQVTDLLRLHDDRNKCAHPTYQGVDQPYSPTAELARAHLVHAVNHVLSAAPVQGKAATDYIIRLVESDFFPEDIKKAKVQLRSGGLDHPKDSLVRAVIDRLIFGFFEGDDKLKHKKRTCIAIEATYELYPALCDPRISKALNSLGRRLPDGDLIFFFVLLSNFPLIWHYLENDNQTRLTEVLRQPSSSLTSELILLALDVPELDKRWSRFPEQNGGLAKVDSGFDYAANFSSVACVA